MEITRWQRKDFVLHSGKTYTSPYFDVEVNAVFTHESGKTVCLPGFWNGNDEWRVRFSPYLEGKWTYEITSNTDISEKGEFTALPSLGRTALEEHGFVRISDDHTRYVYDDGTPFFWLGDTHWQMPDLERTNSCNYPGCNCGNQFLHLLKDRLNKGFTVYQTYFTPHRRGGTPEKDRPNWWQEGKDLKEINPDAFKKVDYIFDTLADSGITIACGFGLHQGTIPCFEDPKYFLAFVRYAVARYACYPMVWITGQEIVEVRRNCYPVWKQVGALVGETDGYHHPNGAHMYVMDAATPIVKDLADQPWHQHFILQGGHGGLKNIQHRNFYRSYAEKLPRKPYIEGEAMYEDIYCSGFTCADSSRVSAWVAMLNGAAGYTYGGVGVWVLNWNAIDDTCCPTYSHEPWYVGMQKRASIEIGYLKSFLQYISYEKMEPVFGYEFASLENRAKTAISHIGQDTFVLYFYNFPQYFPRRNGSTVTGQLFGLKTGTEYNMRWFDTSTGKFIPAGSFVFDGKPYDLPDLPSCRDWALLITCKDLGEYASESMPPIPDPIPAETPTGAEYRIEKISAWGTEPGSDPANMIDGNPETEWRAFAEKSSNCIDIDLGKECELGFLRYESAADPIIMLEYLVEGSNDGVHFDLLLDRLYRRIGVGGAYPAVEEPLQGTYRYIRFYINSQSLEAQKLRFSRIALLAPAPKEEL